MAYHSSCLFPIYNLLTIDTQTRMNKLQPKESHLDNFTRLLLLSQAVLAVAYFQLIGN